MSKTVDELRSLVWLAGVREESAQKMFMALIAKIQDLEEEIEFIKNENFKLVNDINSLDDRTSNFKFE